MATLLKNQTAVARTLSPTTTGTGSVYLNPNEFIFYSNNPEEVTSTSLADSYKFLSREYNLGGPGQIYVWHHNNTGLQITHTLLLHNPNSYAVSVKVSNYGLTNTSNTGMPDTDAWVDYYNGLNQTIDIPANSYGHLFTRFIANGNNFGIVARVNIVRKDNASVPAKITIFDLAYRLNESSANSFALTDPATELRRRGQGKGFYCTMTFPTTAPTNTTGIGYSYAATANTFFGGKELPFIQDAGGSAAATGNLEGGYGMQFNITIPIRNSTSTNQTYRIFIGSRAGNCIPFVNFNGDFAKYNNIIRDGFKYSDVIETDVIAPGQTKSYTFSTVVPALSDTPYMVGVRIKS